MSPDHHVGGGRWTRPNNHRVPRPLITRRGQQDLDRPTQAPMELRPKVTEQRGVRRVSKRLAAWVRTQREVQSHGCVQDRELRDGHTRDEAPFDSADLTPRQPDRTADLGEAEAAVAAAVAKAAAGIRDQVAAARTASVDQSFTRGHLRSLSASG
jgi:hypothetical protein